MSRPPDETLNVYAELLQSRKTWANPAAFDDQARKLAQRFQTNFMKYKDGSPTEIVNAGPQI